jgi:hypothetical protein
MDSVQKVNNCTDTAALRTTYYNIVHSESRAKYKCTLWETWIFFYY